jgi:Gluconate 2-dehydrogenase subunit 3
MDDPKDKGRADKDGLAAPPLTRRELLLNLGSAVILSGLPGLSPETGPNSQSARAPLPPGLYSPSVDHLTHALNSEDPFVAAPAGTETEYCKRRSGAYDPQAFTPREFQVVRRLVELILGDDLKTSAQAHGGIYDEVAEWVDLVVRSAPQVREAARSLSSGHRSLAVAYFGTEEPVRELETFEPERVCREGLGWLDEESNRRYGKAFLETESGDQAALLQTISDARADKSVANAGTRLFDFLKAESIRGFYSSRVGLKELDYKGNAFYGTSPGCGLTP